MPNGDPVLFEADYPPPGGNGRARNPLAYCFWALACYAMTYAQEAARRGIELRRLPARVETDVDLSRALGVSARPPVQNIDWYLEVAADASREVLRAAAASDEHCPGAYCIRNPIELRTHVTAA